MGQKGILSPVLPKLQTKHPPAQSGSYSLAMAWLGSLDHRLPYSNTLYKLVVLSTQWVL